MKKQFILVSIVVIYSVFGCENQSDKLNRKIAKIITSYMEENIDGLTIDSVSIMKIDSLTDLDFAYLQKIIYENKESEICANKMLYIYPDSDEEFEIKEKLQLQLQTVRNCIMLCNNVLLDDKTDTVFVNYLFVDAKIFGKDKKENIQIYEIGFPIDKNLNVKEIDF
jgi:uncharacterized lipoprotein NlpE involved in copper resistance